MDESRPSKSEREEMRRQEWSYQLWRAGGFVVVAVLLCSGAWAIANAGPMRTYWLWSVAMAGLIVLGFLSQGFGWINYGILSALIFLFCALLLAVAMQLPDWKPGAGCCAQACCCSGTDTTRPQ